MRSVSLGFRAFLAARVVAVRRLQRVPLRMDRGRHGFTLLELMIVVTIMGTMAALMAPGIGEFLADSRASAASEDLIRLNRHIRSRAQETGLAHLLVFSGDAAVSGGLGQVLVYEGMNNHCRQTPWPQTTAGSAVDGHTTVDSFDPRTYNPVGSGVTASAGDTRRQVIVLSVRGSQGAPTAATICFEPSGATLEGVGDGSSNGFGFATQTVPITFTITRSVDGVQRGLVREVVFPAGGQARFRF
jgi:prepilin-type N-terminal cleavage/methylation domain-containing protein